MSRSRVGAVVSLALLLAAVAIWLVPSHRVARSFVLPDGTKLSFYQATYGTNHEALYATNWSDRFARFVPARFATNWGFKRVAYVPSTALSSSSNNLVVWFKRSGPVPAPVPLSRGSPGLRVRAAVVDEHGLEASTSMTSWWRGTLQAWLLPNYPRRSPVIHLRFWDTSTATTAGAAQPLLAELEIPNPAPGTAPAWAAETLPAVRVTNDLEISLLTLETGHTAASAGLRSGGFGGGAPATNSRTYSLARVELRESGRPATAWQVQGFQAAAPTGASLNIRGTSRPASAGADGYYFTGVLWPEEPVWELTILVARTSNFPEEETWKVTGIPVPRPGDGQNNTVPVETNMSGVQLVFLGAGPTGADLGVSATAGQISPSFQSMLNVTMMNYSPDLQLRLVSLRTDDGQTVPQTGSSTSMPAPRGGAVRMATYRFMFTLPDGAATMDATFSVSRVRTATFRVKPTLAPASINAK